MDLYDNIICYFQTHPIGPGIGAPAGACPVCWGYQGYDLKIRTLLKDKQIDVNNHRAAYSFIRAFMIRNMDGITLKPGVVSERRCCAEHSDF